VPEFTVIAAPEFEAVPERDGTRTGAFILADFTRKIVLIGGTKYAGEMKKSIFGVMNFPAARARRAAHALLGQRGRGWRTALFFGLSGTGKTTLSADPGTPADRRRRARLEPRRRLQFRGRLLRQMRRPERGERAADLPRHPLRLGAGKRDSRSGTSEPDYSTFADGEHPRRLSRSSSSTTR
jgi:hypothetical protein